MPIWGEILTDDQITALASFTLEAARGNSTEVGKGLYDTNCSACHGLFGEGGPNPAKPNFIIGPISTAEFLKTRDDYTLRAIISQGQPNLGMASFGSANGGPLSDEDIDLIIAYIRTWQANPPVDEIPEVIQDTLSLKGEQIYLSICAQCHGDSGEGLIGPSLQDPEWQAKYTDTEIFSSIKLGHMDSPMISWGDILSDQQIEQLVVFIRELEVDENAPKVITFKDDILPIINSQCIFCHKTDATGWDASTYDGIVNSGNEGPAVIPGDPDNSLLVQKMLGTHTKGGIMPPAGKLPERTIQKVIDWILSGALDN